MATKHIYKMTVDTKKRISTKREDITFMEILTYLCNAQAMLLAEVKVFEEEGEGAYNGLLETLRKYICSADFENDILNKTKLFEEAAAEQEEAADAE